jgi:hypothetical protein
MKSTLKYLFVLLTLPFIAGAQVPLAKVNNQAFGPSEVLEYRVHYGFMDAGTARLEVDPIVKNLGGRTCYRVLGTGRSVGAFDWFFKVRDHYESYIDAEAMVPWLFIRKIEEGSYKKNQNVSFNHFKSTATSEKKTIKTPGQVQDLISAFYYARTLDFEHAAVGDTFLINCYRFTEEGCRLQIVFKGVIRMIQTLRIYRWIQIPEVQSSTPSLSFTDYTTSGT